MENQRNYSRKALMPDVFFSHSITITSETAVGKTRTIEGLRAKMGTTFEYLSGGSFMRKLAESRGLTIEEFARLNQERPDLGFDKKCDDMIATRGLQNYVVIEGRLPHVFVPWAFHVRLICPLNVRATRRHTDYKAKGRTETLSDVIAAILKRDQDDNSRYVQLYRNCLWPDSDYDLVVPTDLCGPDEAVNRILSTHEKWTEDRRDQIVRHQRLPSHILDRRA